ncbi:MAG: cobalamin-dependent protein [Trichlorobacter sp.]|uniref:lipid biosynthesis B12-binding/radical SAM protein n=1 Tax=Trichlorobacter sp. TaxID=2911007 RepID=UPI00256DD4A0|nr:lipid biosynthesis B12-binding/radical SAM protein [Trichlorobacter sp.]MDK9718225.1 cobalamin-dependent protein [Trichlorobacter sp.]
MKLLLVSANRERSPYPVFPLGLAFLAAPLKQAGHKLAVLDLCFEAEPLAALQAALVAEQPEVVIISLRNLDNVTWPDARSYLSGLTDLVTVCKGKATVVVGGSGFSLMPLEVLATCGADIGLVGEGEQQLPLLLDRLGQGADLADLPGVVLPGKTDYIPPVTVKQIGSPDRELFDVARYLKEGGMANLQTKRGCPFGCSYCTYPLLEGQQMRTRPVADIIAEIRSLVDDHGVDYLYFVDDIFNYPTSFCEQLCNAMIDEQLTVNWSAFINPDFITPQLLGLMKRAGCDAIEFGTDSGSPVMLQSLCKSFTLEQVKSASLLCHEAGLDFSHYIIFGGPGETEETILESFRLMDELNPTAVIAMTGVRIYPRTKLYRTALDEGIITTATDLLQPTFYLAPAIKDTLSSLVIEQAMQRKNWIVPGLEVNISDTMLEALRMFKVRGPLWKLLKRMGRSRIAPMSSSKPTVLG